MSFPDTTAHDSLPQSVKPIHYDLHIYNIDDKENTFSGSVVIKFEVVSKTDSITLHQKNLQLLEAKAVLGVSKTSTEVQVTTIEHCDPDDKSQNVILHLSEPLGTGLLTLSIKYKGLIGTNMAGFYASTYLSEKGEKNTLLATQFEATDARCALPCFDEPNAKATFDVTLTVKSDLDVLSNTPVDSITAQSESLKTVKFETTPLMSTYLLAWAIGKFEYIEGFTEKTYKGKKLPVRIYTIPGASESGRFALSVATRVVDFLSKIFESDYVLPKLDLLAVPQFGANAMENFGLITFRATALLYDPLKSDISYQKKVAYVVSHEILHQWFGNYVTMNWWNELWLNEGFATWGGYLAVDNLFPDWKIFEDFVAISYQTALGLDSLRNSHPIEVPVYYSYQIDEVFDPISYLKGASCIRMLAESIGVDVFLKGIAHYLKNNAFGNAKTDDLWHSISEVSGIDIDSLMTPWIKAQGFPYLYAKKVSAEEFIVSQKRFLLPEGPTPKEDTVKWWIPLNVKFSKTSYYLNAEESITINAGDLPFFKLNNNSAGFYRVIYETDILTNIIENIDQLSVQDKIGLIADTVAGATCGLIPTSSCFELIKVLSKESDYAIWVEVVKRLSGLRNYFFENKELNDGLKKFEVFIYQDKLRSLLESTSQTDLFAVKSLTPLLLKAAGKAGYEYALSTSSESFQSNKMEPYLKSSIFQTLMSNPSTCTIEVFDYLVKETLNPSSIDAREVALSALGSISDLALFPKVTDLFFTPSVPDMDAIFLASSLASNPITKKSFWDFFKGKLDKFSSEYPMWTFDRVLKSFLPELVSRELYEDIKITFESRNTDGFEKGLKQGLDSIDNALRWIERDEEDIAQWLKKNNFV